MVLLRMKRDRIEICSYCGEEISRYVPLVRKRAGRVFCNKVCRSKFRERTAPQGVIFERMSCCDMCGFHDIEGEYKEGDICPKCNLFNLIMREEAVKVYERADR